MKMSSFFIAIVAAANMQRASADEANPIGKVLQLLSDLQSKIIGEGEALTCALLLTALLSSVALPAVQASEATPITKVIQLLADLESKHAACKRGEWVDPTTNRVGYP